MAANPTSPRDESIIVGDPTPEQQRTGMRFAHLSQAFGSHLQLFVGTSAIVPLFIKRLGGSDLAAMFPGAFASLATGLQLPVAMFVRPHNIRTFMVRCWYASTFPVLIGLGLALVLQPGPPAVTVVLAGLLVGQVLAYVGATFWFPLLHEVVPAGQRGRFFGRMRALWNAIYLVLGVLAGLFLGSNPPLWKFVAVLGAVALLQLLREPCVARIPVRLRAATLHDWRADWRAVMRRRDLLAFILYFTVLSFLAGFLGQPTVLYMRELGFSAGSNTVIRAMSTAGSALALIGAGVLLDRIGTRRVFLAVHVVLCVLALCLALVAEIPRAAAGPLMIALLVATGAAVAVAGLAFTAQIFHLTPEHGKTFYLGFSTSLTTLGAGLSPLLAGALLDSPLGHRMWPVGGVEFGALQMLFAATGLGLLAAIGLLPMVENVCGGAQVVAAAGEPAEPA